MQWVVIIKDGGKTIQLAIKAVVSEKQGIKQLIQQQYPHGVIVDMMYEIFPNKKN